MADHNNTPVYCDITIAYNENTPAYHDTNRAYQEISINTPLIVFNLSVGYIDHIKGIVHNLIKMYDWTWLVMLIKAFLLSHLERVNLKDMNKI